MFSFLSIAGQAKARLLIVLGMLAGVSVVCLYLATAPYRFISEQVSMLNDSRAVLKNNALEFNGFSKPKFVKQFADGSWIVGVCKCVSSGDSFNAAVLITSDGSTLVSRMDVNGYEGLGEMVYHLNASNVREAEIKLSSLGFLKHTAKMK